MKLIDFDEKFNKKVAEMLEKHAGERTEEEWEDEIAKAYARFGDTYMGQLGKTPRQYFAQMGDAAGEVSSVGFLNSGGSRRFRLRSRSFYFLLVGAGIEKDKSRKNDQYVADFCHN